MTPLDFRKVSLFVGGYRVKQLFVVSLGAERFWKLAFHDRRGLGSLTWSDVQTVEVRDVIRLFGVGNNARKRKLAVVTVQLTRGDSEFALRVANAVACIVENRGYRVLDAIVPQKDEAGELAGEHDLVCERRDPRASAAGKTSLEVKLRMVSSAKTLGRVRRQMQTSSWKLWQAAKKDSSERWAERVCLLLRWSKGDDYNLGDWESTYAESLHADAEGNHADNWKPLWGWDKGLPSAAERKAQAKAAAKARLAAAARVRMLARLRAAATRRFDSLWAASRRCTKRGREMRSVSDLMGSVNTTVCKKVKPNINQRLPVWARKWQWPAHSYDVDTSGACSSKSGGGSCGYVATYEAMRDIYDHVS